MGIFHAKGHLFHPNGHAELKNEKAAKYKTEK
jgi:hypothetical protein